MSIKIVKVRVLARHDKRAKELYSSDTIWFSRSCVIAQAITERFPTAELIQVSSHDVYIDGILWDLDQDAREVIRIFDSGERVSPRTVTIYRNE